MLFTVVRERQNAAGSKTKTITFISTCGSKLLKEKYISLADLGGAAGARPPQTGSISFIFTYVFAEKCTRQRLVPPQWVGAPPPPPTGNPGSATALTSTYSMAYSLYTKFKVCDQLNLAQD